MNRKYGKPYLVGRSGILKVRFAGRDRRAKVASDADSVQRAQEILGHADAEITKRIYVRKARLVRPAKRFE